MNHVLIFTPLLFLTSAQYTVCNKTTCTFSQGLFGTYVCTEFVETCTITGCANSNDCSDITLLSAATTTSLTCQNSDACKNIKFICGYNTNKPISSCAVSCINGNSCYNMNMTCSGNINSCSISTTVSNSILGELNCATTDSSNDCYVGMGVNSGWTNGRVTLKCLSGINHCRCAGSNINCNAVTILTPTPTAAPVTANPTSLTPTTSRAPSFSPTKFPIIHPSFAPTHSPVETIAKKESSEEGGELTALYVVIVILVLIIIGAGVWYYRKHKLPKQGEDNIGGEIDMAAIDPDLDHMANEGENYDVTTAPRDGGWTGGKQNDRPNKPVPIPPEKKYKDIMKDDMVTNGNEKQRILKESDDENNDSDVINPGAYDQYVENDDMVHKISIVNNHDSVDEIDLHSDGDVVGDINTITDQLQ